MKAVMKKVLMAIVVVITSATAFPGTAGAWLKFHNDTPNVIWTAHAFASTSGFLCGYSDGCSGSQGEWRVQGWWGIAPGDTVTVHSEVYGNAKHDIYAEDDFGHVWDGGGGTYCSPSTAFNKCEFGECPGCIGNCPPPPRDLTYRRIRNTTCCGGSCQSNHTVNFVL